jgi:hypothetical protein
VADLELGRDLLDKPLVDRNGAPFGRVDGLILRRRADAPPVVAWLETGPVPLLDRISPRLGALAARLYRRLKISSGEPLRIPPEKIVHFGREIKVDVDATRSAALAGERWIRRVVIGRIPGADR